MPWYSRENRPGTTRRVRMRGFDYRTPGYYFITLCQHDRMHLFGTCAYGQIERTHSGDMIADQILKIPERFANTSIDCSVIMPNHIHILLGIAVRTSDTAGVDSVVEVMHWLKSSTTTAYGYGVRNQGWPGYDGSLWQEGYYDHFVRSESELEAIRFYIQQNPARWTEDEFYEDRR